MKFRAQQARPGKAKEVANVTLTKGIGTSRPVKDLGSFVVDLGKRSKTGSQHPAEGFTGPTKPQTAVSNSLSELGKNAVSSTASTNAPKRFNVTLSKGTHPAEGFTGPSKPQTTVSNVTFRSGENEVSGPASTFWKGKRNGTNTPKRFNVTSTRRNWR